MSEFKKVQPLYYNGGKDGKTPMYYGIGVFFNKKPTVLFRLVNEKDQFSLPEAGLSKAEVRQAAMAAMLGCKLALATYGKTIYNDKEHSYYFTVKTIADRAKVDVSLVVKNERSKVQDDLTAAFALMERAAKR